MAADGIEWRTTPGLSPYAETLAAMEARAAAIRSGEAAELIWLLEHPPLYTAGTSADPAELFNPQGFPVFEAGRGGRYTYHGPGQRVGYVLLDLDKRGATSAFVHSLEGWIIATLARLGIEARRAPGRIGIWVTGRARPRSGRSACGSGAGSPITDSRSIWPRTFPLLRHSPVRYCRLPSDQPRRDGSVLRT
jgi:lipoate-protein ligase B